MKRRTLLSAAAIGLVAVLGWAAFTVLTGEPSITSGRLVGRPLPDPVLSSLDGADQVRLAAPGKVTIVNFWAPWCFPCRSEHRELATLIASASPDDVSVVGVAFQSDVAGVERFLNEFGRDVPALLDVDGSAAIDFGVVGVPETFVADATGTVRAHIVGPATARQLTEILDRLRAGETLDGL